ncbi:MAG: hypothetical protein FWH06_07020, partial [Oscillospiraceae bacterium]|nr:hypothetical protein [Oscillospiraceae bacterium]
MMAEINHTMRFKKDDGSYDTLYPKTTAEQVIGLTLASLEKDGLLTKEDYAKLVGMDGFSETLGMLAEQVAGKVNKSEYDLAVGEVWAFLQSQLIPTRTAGTASALTAQINGFALADGARAYLVLHTNIAGETTLNINGTGAYPLRGAFTRPSVRGVAELVFTVVFDGEKWVSSALTPGPFSGSRSFTSSVSAFNFESLGLNVGDAVTVTVIGGGGGGAAGYMSTSGSGDNKAGGNGGLS